MSNNTVNGSKWGNVVSGDKAMTRKTMYNVGLKLVEQTSVYAFNKLFPPLLSSASSRLRVTVLFGGLFICGKRRLRISRR